VHLDELVAVAERLSNPHIVLMHTSQIYGPAEAREILRRRCPPELFARISLLAPEHGPWL